MEPICSCLTGSVKSPMYPMSDEMLWSFRRRAYHWLMVHRMVRCVYCLNTGEGCDCGACGIDASHPWGYDWCMNNAGCPLCGRHR